MEWPASLPSRRSVAAPVSKAPLDGVGGRLGWLTSDWEGLRLGVPMLKGGNYWLLRRGGPASWDRRRTWTNVQLGVWELCRKGEFRSPQQSLEVLIQGYGVLVKFCKPLSMYSFVRQKHTLAAKRALILLRRSRSTP